MGIVRITFPAIVLRSLLQGYISFGEGKSIGARPDISAAAFGSSTSFEDGLGVGGSADGAAPVLCFSLFAHLRRVFCGSFLGISCFESVMGV